MIMKSVRHNTVLQPLEKALIAFFVLAALSLVIVYIIEPSIYLETLKLQPSLADRYSLPATLFLIVILGFIAFVITGVIRHWRWLFWLILLAFGAAILDIPTTILQLTGVIPNTFPVWYSLYRMGVACVQVGIAVWMVRIWRRDGVWGMGKHRNGGEQESLTGQHPIATMEAHKEED
jgi:hypothetical protein